jgi:hypothetical protein
VGLFRLVSLFSVGVFFSVLCGTLRAKCWNVLGGVGAFIYKGSVGVGGFGLGGQVSTEYKHSVQRG